MPENYTIAAEASTEKWGDRQLIFPGNRYPRCPPRQEIGEIYKVDSGRGLGGLAIGCPTSSGERYRMGTLKTRMRTLIGVFNLF